MHDLNASNEDRRDLGLHGSDCEDCLLLGLWCSVTWYIGTQLHSVTSQKKAKSTQNKYLFHVNGVICIHRYVSAVDKALKNFEYTSEWADLISALGKLNKVSVIIIDKLIIFNFCYKSYVL